ncbi:sce7726 family protein [Paenibacillus kyungheensis]
MYEELLNTLKNELKQENMFLLAKTLHDNYDQLSNDNQVWNLLKNTFPEIIYKEFLHPHKNFILGHQLVNDIIMSKYYGEKKIKYHFTKKHLHRENEISMFEMNIGKSRLDYARINGSSYAYEIKTELDSLDKLSKQIEDYSQVFEYIHVITHSTHLDKVNKIVPEFCSIITYTAKPNDCTFYVRKKRKLNPNYNSASQLKNLNKKELDNLFIKYTLEKRTFSRLEQETILLNKLNKKQVNEEFKLILKKRFEKRWQYLCKNFDQIQPIDMQSFFKSFINPKWVYYKNSSIV